MADNYLEVQMEKLRSGKLKPSPSKRKVGSLALQRALVVGKEPAAVEAEVTALLREGCKVAFFYLPESKPESSDAESSATSEALNPTGTAFARRSGSRFYPGGRPEADWMTDVMRRLVHDWKGLEILRCPDLDTNEKDILMRLFRFAQVEKNL